jgi:hypothetical protein
MRTFWLHNFLYSLVLCVIAECLSNPHRLYHRCVSFHLRFAQSAGNGVTGSLPVLPDALLRQPAWTLKFDV